MMDRALQIPLTLVSAPAGYGKSVLASDWVRAQKHNVTWLSLDETDGDLRQFLSCLASAIEDLVPDACYEIREQLSAPELAPLVVLAHHLVNDLDKLVSACVIILDDFHRLERGSPVAELLSVVLEHPPPALHLVILTRRDPHLQLSKLRVGGQLAEIRPKDLRFSPGETEKLITSALDQKITTTALEHLDDEVEGWAAGLRLVALALQNSDDPNALLISLHGGLQQTQEYMLSEVVESLSPAIRRCLLQSSILDHFNADLINEVCFPDQNQNTENLEGQNFIETLDKGNIFAYSLDSRGEWFRYHHWFQFMLRRQLERSFSAEDIQALHIHAGRWFEANEEVSEALPHFLAAGDVAAAENLISKRVRHHIENDEWFVIERWLNVFPEGRQNDRPDMHLTRAWVGFCQLDIEAVQASVDRLEALLTGTTVPAQTTYDIEFLRGWLAFWSTDMGLAKTHFTAAIDGFDLSPGMIAGELRLYFALATGLSGDYPAAIRFLENERLKAGKSAGLSYTIRVIAAQAHLHLLFGNIQASILAVDIFGAAISHTSNRYAEGWEAYLHSLQNWHLYKRERSLEFYLRAREHRNLVERRAAIDLLAGLALVQQSLQQSGAANDTLDELATLARDFGDFEHETAARSCRARVGLMRGNTEEALNWARSASVPTPSPVGMYLWGDEPIVTRSRVLVVAGVERDVSEGLAILDGLFAQIQNYGIVCQLIDVQLLRALALYKMGNTDQATSILVEVLPVAARGGWVRPFVELGTSMADLLNRLEVRGAERDFVQRILKHIENSPPCPVVVSPSINKSTTPEPAANAGFGPDGLTNRELDILECLDQRLQNKEIAAKLHISTHTVGYHLKHIYQKLDVNSRRQAVVRASKMGVLPPQ